MDYKNITVMENLHQLSELEYVKRNSFLDKDRTHHNASF